MESEVRILEVDKETFIKEIEELGAKKKDAGKDFLKIISYQEDKLTTLDVDSIYRGVYHINLGRVSLVFEDAK